MNINVEIGGRNYRVELLNAKSLAIPLLPNGEQPTHFGVDACTSEPVKAGSFIGDTQQGGSCNCETLTLTAHCNGTHTESVAHVVDDNVSVFSQIGSGLFSGVIVSIEPQLGSTANDHYLPSIDDSHRVITKQQIEDALKNYDVNSLEFIAIRTLPNTDRKKTWVYDENNYPVYLTNDAMDAIVEKKVKHLLVDFPSVDKMYDDGMLSNHRIFWNLSEKQNRLNESTALGRTITEMIYVEDSIPDGFYLLNLQLPSIDTDAVPSSPIVYPLKKI